MSQSNTVKAGRLLFLLGAIALAGILLVAGDILLYGQPTQDFVGELAIAFMSVALCFVVGAGVYEYRPWARILGVIISLLSLVHSALGIIGLLALSYLVRGWREQPLRARGASQRTVRGRGVTRRWTWDGQQIDWYYGP